MDDLISVSANMWTRIGLRENRTADLIIIKVSDIRSPHATTAKLSSSLQRAANFMDTID
jgi:hypothetical protein